MIKYLQGDAILLHPKTLRENCISIPDDDCIYYIKHFYSDLDEKDRTRMYAAVYKKDKPHLEFSVPVKDLIDESISLNMSEKDRIIEGDNSIAQEQYDTIPPYHIGDILEFHDYLYYYNGYSDKFSKDNKITLFLVQSQACIGDTTILGHPYHDALSSYPTDAIKLIQRS